MFYLLRRTNATCGVAAIALFMALLVGSAGYGATTVLAATPDNLPTMLDASITEPSAQGFSGDALGASATHNLFSLDHATDVIGDQRFSALLVDGRYDFMADTATDSSVHPYVLGGAGMAAAEPFSLAGDPFENQSLAMTPMFRMGGGVAYRLGDQWDLSLDYKTDVAGQALSGDQIFTSRGQHPVDSQSLNMGVKVQF